MVHAVVQVPAIDTEMLRDIAAILRGSAETAQTMRAQLRSLVAKPRLDTVFDIFGSDLPDAYFDGVFTQSR